MYWENITQVTQASELDDKRFRIPVPHTKLFDVHITVSQKDKGHRYVPCRGAPMIGTDATHVEHICNSAKCTCNILYTVTA